MKSKQIKNSKEKGGHNIMQKSKCKLSSQKRNLNSSKGITLIALVVTIVVLLILAGVSINAIFSENGLIQRAKSAKSTMSEAKIKEEIEQAILSARIKGLGTLTKENIKEELEKIDGATVTDNGEKLTVTKNESAFNVDLSGNITPANGIALNKTTLKLLKGASETLTVSYLGNASGNITWTSSNTSAATVEDGVISTTLNSTGTTTITATCESYTATCEVTIISRVTSISASNLEVGIGASKKIAVTTVPTTEIEDLTYSSSNTSIATVDEEGNVTGIAGGTATITIKGSVSIGVSGTCTVTVKEPTFADYTWQEIKALAQAISNDNTITNQTSTPVTKNINGKNYTAKLGDTKSIKIKNAEGTEETYLVQIIGFNHDTKTSGGKAGITFQMQDCLNTKAKMNSSDKNTGGWKASKMRNFLNTNETYNVYDNIEEGLREIIVPVDKRTGFYESDSWVEEDETTSDKLWLLAEYEVLGAIYNSGCFKENKRENDYLTQYAYYVGRWPKSEGSKWKYLVMVASFPW